MESSQVLIPVAGEDVFLLKSVILKDVPMMPTALLRSDLGPLYERFEGLAQHLIIRRIAPPHIEIDH